MFLYIILCTRSLVLPYNDSSSDREDAIINVLSMNFTNDSLQFDIRLSRRGVICSFLSLIESQSIKLDSSQLDYLICLNTTSSYPIQVSYPISVICDYTFVCFYGVYNHSGVHRYTDVVQTVLGHLPCISFYYLITSRCSQKLF